MKKLIMIPVALISAFAFGQKPENGTITTEVGMSLNNAWSNISSIGLNGRYFINPGMAVTLGVGMGNNSQENRFWENANGTGNTGTYLTKSSSTNFGLGFQKHFAGNEKLSPFLAIGFNLSSGKSSEEGENSNGNNYVNNYTRKIENSNSSLGFNLGLGFDYWFANGLFIGVQYNPIGWSSTTYKDQVTTTNGTKTVQPRWNSSSFTTFGTTPFFRLGWRFN